MGEANSLSPIGIFDSGVGGISVLARIAKVMPQENLWYFGDLAHAPYGTKPVSDVLRFCTEIAEDMCAIPVKAIVIACNTASSVAAQALREQYALPIIAMEPALKPASQVRHGGKVLVLATPNTLALPKFQHLYELYGTGAERVPCPGLMELVEKQDRESAEVYLRDTFSHFPGQIDAVVLGCTHYVFLREIVRKLLPEEVAIMDGNLGTALQLQRVLRIHGLEKRDGMSGTISFHTSSTPDTDPDTKKKQEISALSRMQVMFQWANQLLDDEIKTDAKS